MQLNECRELAEAIRDRVSEHLYGLEQPIEYCLIGLVAGGHVLLQGVPGLGKTALVNSLARLLDLEFRRIQFTPDLMPSDITGSEILDVDSHDGGKSFRFVQGPIFTNLLLADEINRTPPRTQAALLEAMQERRVTIGQKSYELAPPFLVYATMNPLEQEGTYPLPEAELDRFLLQVELQYPSPQDEQRIAADRGRDPTAELKPVADAAAVLALQARVEDIEVPQSIIERAVQLVRSTRPQEPDASEEVKRWVRFGAGPRASQSLIRAAAARALLHGRPLVDSSDLQAVTPPVLRHRVGLGYEALAQGIQADQVLHQILSDHGVA